MLLPIVVTCISDDERVRAMDMVLENFSRLRSRCYYVHIYSGIVGGRGQTLKYVLTTRSRLWQAAEQNANKQ